jgi:hypothetical protein
LSPDLQKELETLTLPLDGTSSESRFASREPSWSAGSEGLFHGIQAALWAQHAQARAGLEEMRRRGRVQAHPRDPAGSIGPGSTCSSPVVGL